MCSTSHRTSEAHAYPVPVCGPRHGHGHWAELGRWERRFAPEYDPGFGAFGVRRPLRFLAYKLQLDEAQVAQLAQILNELKTERAQGAVDDRRTTAAFADAVAGEEFDRARAEEGATIRVQSAERIKAAVLESLARIHALLDSEQRSRLAYLIRTGTLTL